MKQDGERLDKGRKKEKAISRNFGKGNGKRWKGGGGSKGVGGRNVEENGRESLESEEENRKGGE